MRLDEKIITEIASTPNVTGWIRPCLGVPHIE